MSQVEIESEDKGGRKTILSVRNLTVIFKSERVKVTAVRDVSFDIQDSEVFSIVGESGSGKTTIARCIMGLVKASHGSITYEGSAVASLNGKRFTRYLGNVQMVFQDPYESLNPRHDIFTVVSAPIKYILGEKDESKVMEMTSRVLGEVGLNASEVINRFPHQLSGGQRQRVILARALAPNPKLLIADEPITMLDAAQRLHALALLKDLKSTRNLSVLLITHDLASARLLSNRVMIMYKGEAFELGPTDAMISRPLHPYTETILSAMPTVAGVEHDAKYMEGTDPSAVPEYGCIYRNLCLYSTNICSEKRPVLEPKSEGRLVSCHNPLNV